MEVTIMTYLQKAYKAIFISSIIVFSAITSEAQAGWNQPAGQFLINAIRISGYLFFCGEPVPLNIPDVKERLEKELLVSLDNSDNVILWIKRANRYFPYIEKF